MTGRERQRGCLLGLAAGDAVGSAVEFHPRGSFAPITDMVGGGPFDLEPGEWTDDTSMALCLGTSLVECGGFDAADQMRRYCRWAESGYLSSNGTCFDIGGTVAGSLRRFRRDGEPFAGPVSPDTAGNGCIMRLAPIAMFFFPDVDATRHFAAESSRTTHGAAECRDACRLLAGILCRALGGAAKEAVLSGDAATFRGEARIAAIARGDYRGKPERDIRGTGYVVASLEAALWCFARSETFEEAVLLAANLGDDADTTAAVCGQVAGAFHGEAGIPAHWRERLSRCEEITALADRLAGGNRTSGGAGERLPGG